jgi:hypothetical protein
MARAVGSLRHVGTEGVSMTTRKPKLNLLYVPDSSTPWLQLAVVTADRNPSQQHARHWQSVRFGTELFAAPAKIVHRH